jgi:hypothetical protein
VQTIYLGLALLLAIALVGFGLGGAFGGGSVFESLSKEGGGSSGYSSKIAAAEKKIKKQPGDANEWAELARQRLHQASTGEYYDSTAEAYTTKGKQELRKTAEAWEQYLKLESKKPSIRLAKDMVDVFDATGLNEPAKAVEALQIVIANPQEAESEIRYYDLAYYAYLAGNTSLGDLAAKKTAELAPKAKRPIVEVELERVKKSVEAEASSSATGGASVTTTSTTSAATSTTSSATTSAGTGGSSKGSSSGK